MTEKRILVSPCPVPVVLDTDIGDDIDDTWALAMLLGCPQVELKLIVTAWGNTPARTRLVAKLLERIGRTDIPIATGIKTGNAELHQAAWLGDYDLAAYPGAVFDDGVQALVDTINNADTPVVLMVIGPQTNIRAALERDPGIARNARIVTMAGSIEIGYNGQAGRCPEYNVLTDIDAAKAVFAAPWDITLAPLDSCGTLRLTGDRYAAVAQSRNPRAVAAIENYERWDRRHHYPKGESSVLFDTVAAHLAFDESLCEMKTIRLSIDDDGNTVPNPNGRLVRCAMAWKDRNAFAQVLITALTSPPTPSR